MRVNDNFSLELIIKFNNHHAFLHIPLYLEEEYFINVTGINVYIILDKLG